MRAAIHKMVHRSSAMPTNAQLMRMVRFPAIRRSISGALARAIPEKVAVHGGSAYVRFRLADPRSFHPALFATIPVGNHGTLLVIGTPRSAVKKPRELEAFIRRMGRGLKTEGRRSLIYQLRAAGIIGGSETQAVLVPRGRVLSAVRMYSGSASGRVAANPILATIGFNPDAAPAPAAAPAPVPVAPAPAAKANARKHRFIPGLSKWHMSAGGTFAAAGKHGYSIFPSVGNYYISPVSWPNGRHRGYLVQFANTQGKLPGPLLWRTLGTVSSPNQGVILAQSHYDKNFGGGKNPLTRREAAYLLSAARSKEVHSRHSMASDAGRAYLRGIATGMTKAVAKFGPRKAKHLADRMYERLAPGGKKRRAYRNPSRVAGSSVRTNPGTVEIKVPFRDGQKITPARMREWLSSLPKNPVTSAIKGRFEKGLAQYKRFHLGSEPTSFTYRAIPMGSQGKRITDVDMVVSEGKEWAAPYQVPKSSGKYDPNVQGRYIHAHGESKMDIDIKKAAPTSKLPERFHTADGKFVGVVPTKNVTIRDWYRG